jgi:hypothetical protein
MAVRDARAEAAERVGHRFDVRVLEPSPPTVDEPPFFADDPVEGGEIVPVERIGSRSWAQLCDEEDDAELRSWCEDRWLIRTSPAPLPESFARTVTALHTLAEHVLAPARHAANGKIGLRFTYRGFGTPFFGPDRQVRVEEGVLVDGERRHAAASVADAGAFIALPVGVPTGVYTPATPYEPHAPLAIDPAAAGALGDWYGFGASLIEQLRADATASDDPGRVQVWPEHFDIAVVMGPAGERANYGASPGDATHREPYLYIAPFDYSGPFDTRQGEFWNEPFGASLSYAEILAGADPLAFLRRGRALLTAR